jgi:hypothetical protein
MSPDRKMAIAVSTGDENTGRPGEDVATKYTKGPATAAVINRNQLLLGPEFEQTEEDIEVQATWILLIRSERGVVSCELSLPEAVDANGNVQSWAHRFHFEVDLPEAPLKLEPVANEPDIAVEVTRKAQ